VAVSLARGIRGRVARDTIIDVINDEIVVRENELITEEIAERIEGLGHEKIRIRSTLTCEASLGSCARCYGMDLSRGTLAERGLAVGIIAAQSIGEPGTQLTMRTFHIGGTASKAIEESEIHTKRAGKIGYINLHVVENEKGDKIVLNRKGELVVLDVKGRELDRFLVPIGARVVVGEGDQVKEKQLLCDWDPHHVPILAETGGIVRYEDIVEGKTLKLEKEARSKVFRKMIMEHKGEMHPQILIVDEDENVLSIHPLPERAYIEVENGAKVKSGTMLAKSSRDVGGIQDITGGLPRVTELFEARRPKEPAVLAELDGVVELGDKKRSKRTIIVRGEGGVELEHLVPHGSHLRVHRGDHVIAGEPLTEGALVPHDLLRISGEQAVLDYLLKEIQQVYRAQGVTVDNKHIEIILGQMMRKVQIEDAGDSEFLPGAVVDKFRFRNANEELRTAKKKPATAAPLLLGVTKASLQSESFISAASFQETTKVLTEAALAGRRDELLGLKENVILGHLVPTGTGFPDYQRTSVRKNIDLHAAAAELMAHTAPAAVVDEGGPALTLEIETDEG
ncbi:MAG: DNA-directed RNA polymerase subunit beta', partial [Planctomycetes bacterium]|nr:DNA-directed RNA polymerase subunit beta' [Planctomycetota bacterium]